MEIFVIIWVIVTNCVCCDFDDCDFVEKVQQQSCVSPVINGCFTAPCPESPTHHPRSWFRPIILREKIPILIILTCYQYQLPIYLAFSDVLKEVWYYIVCIFIHMIYCEVGSRR